MSKSTRFDFTRPGSQRPLKPMMSPFASYLWYMKPEKRDALRVAIMRGKSVFNAAEEVGCTDVEAEAMIGRLTELGVYSVGEKPKMRASKIERDAMADEKQLGLPLD